jgi:hypothetical protein
VAAQARGVKKKAKQILSPLDGRLLRLVKENRALSNSWLCLILFNSGNIKVRILEINPCEYGFLKINLESVDGIVERRKKVIQRKKR